MTTHPHLPLDFKETISYNGKIDGSFTKNGIPYKYPGTQNVSGIFILFLFSIINIWEPMLYQGITYLYGICMYIHLNHVTNVC